MQTNNDPSIEQPTGFQFGDRVRAVLRSAEHGDWAGEHLYEVGTEVEGVIINAVNSAPRMLRAGRVEVRLDNGHRLWVQALDVVESLADRDHPLTLGLPVTPWSCGCGRSGYAYDESSARAAHRSHQHR